MTSSRNKSQLPEFIMKPYTQWPGHMPILKCLKKLNKSISMNVLRPTMPMQYRFKIHDDRMASNNFSLILTVLKGSLRTFVWNKYARIDDEYELSMETMNGNEYTNTSLWQIFGIDGLNNHVISWNVNWNAIKSLYSTLSVSDIGISVFIKFLSLYLTTLPSCIQEHHFINPMPVTLMIHYLFSVVSCPCIQYPLTSEHLYLLKYFDDRGVIDKFELEQFTQLVDKFIQLDGNSVWLPFIEKRPNVNSHSIQLSLKYLKDALPYARKRPLFVSPTYTCWRVIEIRCHPLGKRGVVIVLELVDSSCWTKNSRYVIVDPGILLDYILYVPRDENDQQDSIIIEALDEMAWKHAVSQWYATSINNTSSTLAASVVSYGVAESHSALSSPVQDTPSKTCNIYTESSKSENQMRQETITGTQHSKNTSKSSDLQEIKITSNIDFAYQSMSNIDFHSAYDWGKLDTSLQSYLTLHDMSNPITVSPVKLTQDEQAKNFEGVSPETLSWVSQLLDSSPHDVNAPTPNNNESSESNSPNHIKHLLHDQLPLKRPIELL